MGESFKTLDSEKQQSLPSEAITALLHVDACQCAALTRVGSWRLELISHRHLRSKRIQIKKKKKLASVLSEELPSGLILEDSQCWCCPCESGTRPHFAWDPSTPSYLPPSVLLVYVLCLQRSRQRIYIPAECRPCQGRRDCLRVCSATLLQFLFLLQFSRCGCRVLEERVVL